MPLFKPFLFDLNRIDDKDLLGSVQKPGDLLSLEHIKYRFHVSVVGFLLQELHRLQREGSLLHEFYRTTFLQDSLKRLIKKKFGLETEESVKINQIKDFV